MSEIPAQAQAAYEPDPSLLDQIIAAVRLRDTDSSGQRERDMIGAFVDEVMTGEMTWSRDVETMVNSRILQLDHLISIQLREIMHNETFQRVEATWRGLEYLVGNSEISPWLKVRVLNVTKRELLRDFQRAVEYDDSALYKKVVEEEYETLGGEPYAVLLGAYEFDNSPYDVELLENLAAVAAEAHAPFIGAAAPGMFNFESFRELGGPRELSRIFDNERYLKWKAFRESEHAHYVGLVLPHILLRPPYAPENRFGPEFEFDENVDGTDHTHYLWGNAVFAFGVRLTAAFSRYGWCGAIHGVESGGLVGGLPVHQFQAEEGDIQMKCPTEIPVTDRREAELARLGFIPLCHHKGADKAVFFSVPSCQAPTGKYRDPEARANAGLAAQLDYVMAGARFAHYIKAIMRDKLGAFKNAGECAAYLNRWIAQFVLLDDTAPAEMQARLPLREAHIDIVEVRGKPGTFRAIAHLRAAYQLDQMTVPMRIPISLPQSRVA